MALRKKEANICLTRECRSGEGCGSLLEVLCSQWEVDNLDIRALDDGIAGVLQTHALEILELDCDRNRPFDCFGETFALNHFYDCFR